MCHHLDNQTKLLNNFKNCFENCLTVLPDCLDGDTFVESNLLTVENKAIIDTFGRLSKRFV